MYRIRIFSLLICAFISVPVLGQNLYSGEVQVPDQSAAERQKAVPSALIQVLQKHSGQREIPLHPALDAALLNANRAMVSFHYQQKDRANPDGSFTNELHLVANFLPEAIEKIVQELGLPRWPQQRLPLTIWIVVDDGLGRRLKPVEYAYAWDAMTEVASLRGLPVRWPELDAETEQQVDLQLLWGGFTDSLGVEGENPDDIVIVAARREGPVWNVRWNFAGGRETDGWRIRDSDLAFALVDGIHRLVDLVSARDAISSAGQGNWKFEFRVGGLASASDYVRARSYLESLGVVEAVDVVEIGPAGIVFALDLNAAPEYFEREIGKNRFLAPVTGGQGYQLLPEDSFNLPAGGVNP